MKKSLFILFLFCFPVSETYGQTVGELCPPPGISKQNNLFYSTWAHSCYSRIENYESVMVQKVIQTFSYYLYEDILQQSNSASLLNGASTLAWLLNKQGQLDDKLGVNQNEERIYTVLRKAKASPYDRAKVLLNLAYYWRKLGEVERLKAVLVELLASLPNVQPVALDHDNPRKYVLNGVLNAQKSAGMHDWYYETYQKYADILK
ncbi:hypothetical protein [Terasakiella sp. SH-1]|uniref:hypothetical protein n=1 Tax=Terasakiella sp. SH-1 TaxID=2560057 RepID=UPI0010743928|nr:hypothetical protein [Terasakiella sp. SH-1]